MPLPCHLAAASYGDMPQGSGRANRVGGIALHVGWNRLRYCFKGPGQRDATRILLAVPQGPPWYKPQVPFQDCGSYSLLLTQCCDQSVQSFFPQAGLPLAPLCHQASQTSFLCLYSKRRRSREPTEMWRR